MAKQELTAIPYSAKELESRASKYTLIYPDPYLRNDEIYIDKRSQLDGSVLFSISNGRSVLTKEGFFEYEPFPSSRDEKYFKRARYKSLNLELSGVKKKTILLSTTPAKVTEAGF
jgi:hypothetical protein